MDLPDKVYFRIGEVATLLGVQPHVVRFWQQQFPTVKPERSKTGRFLYTRNTVEQLAFIQRLLKDEGYTIAGAKKALRERGTTGKKRAKAGASAAASAETAVATDAAGASSKVDKKAAEAASAELKLLKANLADLKKQLAAAQSERDSARTQLLALKKLVRREVAAADAVVANLGQVAAKG